MKRGLLSTALAGVFLLLLAACNSENSSPGASRSLAAVLDLNAQARGGMERFSKLRALRLQVQITEPGFQVSGTYVATREGYVRIDVYSNEQRVFSEALGPEGGWQWRAGAEETQALSTSGEAALRRGLVSNLYALYEWPEQGYELKIIDGQDQGQSHTVVEARETDGFTKRLLLDPNTHLVTQIWETSALHPDIDSRKTEQYTQVQAWETVNGILMPTLTEKIDAESGETIQRAEVTALELLQVGVARPAWADPEYFGAPDFAR